MSNRTGSRYHRELVLVFVLLFYALINSPRPPTVCSKYRPPPSFILPRLQMRDGACWPSRSLTAARCYFPWICGLLRVAVAARKPSCTSVQPDVQILRIHAPPSLASTSRRMFVPCEESNSRMVLISRERRPEHPAIAVRSPHGMSIQPGIPIFVTTPSPWRDNGCLDESR